MHKVAVVVSETVEMFGLGALCELWAEPYHADDDNPVFDFAVCTASPGRVTGSAGVDLQVTADLQWAADADLVCLAPKRRFWEVDEPVIELLGNLAPDQVRIFAHCTAAFTLGQAGLLDGRRCTTHWRYAERLARRYPGAIVNPDVLYVHDGHVTTGAGSAAVLDAGLDLLRERFGAHTAATAARRMVVPPHRSGGQAQFISRPVPDCDARTLGPLLEWIAQHLSDDLSVDALAQRSHMSARTFARRFRDETGQTPHAWVTDQRVLAAEELLESGGLSIEQVAHRVGFSNAGALRHHFARARGVPPQAYQRTFAGSGAAAGRRGSGDHEA